MSSSTGVLSMPGRLDRRNLVTATSQLSSLHRLVFLMLKMYGQAGWNSKSGGWGVDSGLTLHFLAFRGVVVVLAGKCVVGMQGDLRALPARLETMQFQRRNCFIEPVASKAFPMVKMQGKAGWDSRNGGCSVLDSGLTYTSWRFVWGCRASRQANEKVVSFVPAAAKTVPTSHREHTVSFCFSFQDCQET